MAELTPQWAAFLQEWADVGGPVARANSLPVGAMLACASVESAWGTGQIYRDTLNPFSLQKWPHVPFPHTHKTFWRRTKIQEDPPKFALAPFNCATDVADAVLQWCEWILHWGEADGPPGNQDPKVKGVARSGAIANRDQLLSYRGNSLNFAFNLPLVGFGEGGTPEKRAKSGKGYRDRLTDFSLYSFD